MSSSMTESHHIFILTYLPNYLHIRTGNIQAEQVVYIFRGHEFEKAREFGGKKGKGK